jgi:hypothetical protein
VIACVVREATERQLLFERDEADGATIGRADEPVAPGAIDPAQGEALVLDMDAPADRRNEKLPGIVAPDSGGGRRSLDLSPIGGNASGTRAHPLPVSSKPHCSAE